MSYLTKSLLSILTISLIGGCSVAKLPPQLKIQQKEANEPKEEVNATTTKTVTTKDVNATELKVKSDNLVDDMFKEVDESIKPYYVNGKWYYPIKVDIGESFEGVASWYGPDFHGKKTSNGENYDMYDFTAAHRTLPFNTMLKVTNLKNRKTTVVRVNDRGPFVQNRLIDLSFSAAKDLDIINYGTALVKLEVVGFNKEVNFEHIKANPKIKPTTPEVEVEVETKDIIEIVEQEKKSVKSKEETKAFKEIETTEVVHLPEPTSVKQIAKDKFSVQIGAFKNLDGAERIKYQYSNIDKYESIVKESTTDGEKIYKVWLSGFTTYEEARSFIDSNAEFAGAFIIMGE